MSIKQRIYWSFFILVFLFVVNGIASIITLNNNKELSDGISTVTDPSLQAIKDFEDILVASRMYTTNWVFLRSSQEDKDALRKLHNIDYPKVKQRLNLLSVKWNDNPSEDSLNKIFVGFEQLLRFEKKIMASLQKFEDYDDPMKRLEAEQIVEDELLPRTSRLMTALVKIDATGQNLRIQKNKYLEHSSMLLRILTSVLAVTIICIGIFLSLYMTKIIIGPINKIRHIVNDLGKGITSKVNYKISHDEIGEMVRSVNNLSEKLHSSAAFANEIGNRNFDSHFEALGPDDMLGKAIIAMRDNLKSSDERMTEAQHIAKIGSWEWDLTTNKLFWSDETHNIFDTDPKTFSPGFEEYLSFIHPEDREYTNNVITKCLQDHQPFAYELRLTSNKNVAKLLFAQGKVIVNDKDEVIKMFGTGQDITERKRGEEKLASEQELLRIIIENIPDQVYVKDTEGRFLHCNMPGAINAGCESQADIIGKTDFDFFPPEDAKHYFEVEQDIMKTGKSLINQEDFVPDKITGEPHWSLNTKVPIKDGDGKMIGLIGINRDITQRKLSEKKVEDVNRELNILFNSIDEVFFSVDMANFKVIQISKTCEKLYGYKQSEFMNNYMLWIDIIHPDDKYLIENEDDEMRRGEQINNQYRIIRKDKNIRWVETKITPTLDKDGKLMRVDGVTRDITIRKNAEDELHKSEERYRQIVETAQEGIWMIDENNNTTFINKKMCEIIEYSPVEIMGKRIHDFMDEEGKKNAPEQIERRKQGISETHDSKFITKSGKDVWTSLSTNPVFDDAGIYKGALAMMTDITKRKHDEELLQKSQGSLAINNHKLEQKNKELEQFAYVASHDLQEPLRTTISFVEIFKLQYFGKLDAKADKYLSYIVQASDRMRVLIKDLLDFSRIGINKDMEKVDCNVILREVITDIDKAIKDSNVKIIAEELPVMSGYATELKQLFQNLILNSIKFRKKDVPLKIDISAYKKNDYWRFAFTDNGIGIDPQHYERIFIIFQRLHNRTEYQGSGIGLSHCKKIVELHHGKIWVDSTVSEGSTFYFTIHSPKEKTHEPKIKLHNAY